jgi:hypothetical protein
MTEAPDPQIFFGERFPAQLNRALGEQEQAAATAQRTLDGMRGVDATIRFVVTGAGGGSFFVNLAGGRSSAASTAAQRPSSPSRSTAPTTSRSSARPATTCSASSAASAAWAHRSS